MQHRTEIKQDKSSYLAGSIYNVTCQDCDKQELGWFTQRGAQGWADRHSEQNEITESSIAMINIKRSLTIEGASNVLTSVVLWLPVLGVFAVEALDILADLDSGKIDATAAVLVILGVISRVSPAAKGETGLA